MLALLLKSDKSGKKYKLLIDKHTVHFGDSAYKDFTQHADNHRKDLYLKRHSKREDWDDPLTAGFWARWLLWNQKSVAKSIQYIKTHFDIKVINLLAD